MSLPERLIVKLGAYLLPEKVAFRLARAFLATQGVGWGGGIRSSGEFKFIKNRIGKLNKSCVFDVGANVGDYSVAVLKANDTAQLHLFEPSQIHYEVLRSIPSLQNAAINQFGLSENDEVRKLYKDNDITGLASIISRDLEHLGIRLNKTEVVKLETGDSYVSRLNIKKIDLLKIDVEGWEMSVLKGFSESFSKGIIHCCQFEFGHAHIERRENFRDFFRFFVQHGFSVGVLNPNGLVNFISNYDEIFENYYTTNYVAALPHSN
jgi:FkbM family methyltransferase